MKGAKEMAVIQFYPGLSWESIPKTKISYLIDRQAIIERLSGLRVEWQEAEADGRNPLKIQASVGLMINDLCDLLELSDVKEEILGPKLLAAVNSFCDEMSIHNITKS
jgi:hypothetical protein